MTAGNRIIKRISLLALLILLALPGIGFAQTSAAPSLTALSFAPTAINTSAGPATVTVSFTSTDTFTGISYFETAFLDPSGVVYRRASKNLSPPRAPATDSVAVAFPQFSPPGTWTLAYVFIADTAGGTLYLDSNGLAAGGFPTALPVTSALDTTPPNITAFSFTPATISTAAASAVVTVNFTVTDDLSGANSFQALFTSPSGNQTVTASATFAAATTVTSSATATFPGFGEAGTWTVNSVIITDAVGNTLLLGPTDLSSRGFPSTLTVTSASDTTPPALTGFSFAPASINVSSAPATVTVNFQATDDLSGVTNVQTNFLSPSGATTQTAVASFAANKTVTGSATATFPRTSENGTWTVSSVIVTDAVGNTQTLATSDLVARGFPTQLSVINTNPNPTQPVIVPTVSPAPGASGWNSTVPVTVTWSVTDPSGGGIASSTGCGTTTLVAETGGTTLQCTATTNSGGTGSGSVTVRIDTRPPTIVPIITPAPNAAGWNNTNVTLNWTVTDPISGINSDVTTGCDPVALSTETAGVTFTCMAVDGAGLAASMSVTIKIDKTPPTATAVASPAPNAAGWNSTNVTVTFTGADSLSGIASCTAPIILSTEGAGQTASGTCTDRAGNVSAPATVSGINIDKTAPVVVPTVSPAPNAAGWNNTSPVTVSWSVMEPSPGSSITSSSGCTTSTVTAATAGTTFTCTATNIAGLTTTVSVTVKLDTIPPVTTATPVPGTLPPFVPLATVNATAVVKSTTGTTLGTITVTCFDTLGLSVKLNAVDNAGGSGVASLTYAASGGQTIPSTTVNGASAQPSITANGLTTLTFAAKDVAGNQEATKSESVVVGIADNTIGFACAAPTPTFVIPTHGKLALTGTVTSGGFTLPFSQNITF